MTNTISSDLNSTAYSSSIWYAIPKGGICHRTAHSCTPAPSPCCSLRRQRPSPGHPCPVCGRPVDLLGCCPLRCQRPFLRCESQLPGATAVAWAYDLRIVRGTGGTLFVPDRPITRGEAAVLLRRYAVHLGRDTFLPSGWPPVTTLGDLSLGGRLPLLGRRHRLLAWGADGGPEPQGTLSPEELEQALARF